MVVIFTSSVRQYGDVHYVTWCFYSISEYSIGIGASLITACALHLPTQTIDSWLRYEFCCILHNHCARLFDFIPPPTPTPQSNSHFNARVELIWYQFVIQ